MPYVITSACIDVNDRSCMDECPVDCIYEGGRKSYIHPKECIDCGACIPACPVDAIVQDRKLGTEQQMFADDSRAFFEVTLAGRDTPLGTPGGAQAVGRVGVDTPLVTGW